MYLLPTALTNVPPPSARSPIDAGNHRGADQQAAGNSSSTAREAQVVPAFFPHITVIVSNKSPDSGAFLDHLKDLTKIGLVETYVSWMATVAGVS